MKIGPEPEFDTFSILQYGIAAAGQNRHIGAGARIGAVEVRQVLEVIDLALAHDAGEADPSQGQAVRLNGTATLSSSKFVKVKK